MKERIATRSSIGAGVFFLNLANRLPRKMALIMDALVTGGEDMDEKGAPTMLLAGELEATAAAATATATATATAPPPAGGGEETLSTSLAQRPSRTKSNYSASLQMQRSKSYGDGHGFTVHAPDDDYDEEKTAVRGGKKDGIGEGEGGEKPLDEVRWDGEGDATNPRNFGTAKKWVIVIVVSAGSTCVTCTSSMYTLTYGQITGEFGVSRVVATLGLSVFVMGLGVGPMLLSPLSEFYGRRPIYMVSFAFFLIWLVCIISRFFLFLRPRSCWFVLEQLPPFREASDSPKTYVLWGY